MILKLPCPVTLFGLLEQNHNFWDKSVYWSKARPPPLPPRVDATSAETAKALFALPADHRWQYEGDGGKVYRCVECKREINYPETLYGVGQCESYHDGARSEL